MRCMVMVKATPELIALVDKFLDELTYPEIAERLNARGLRPGGSVGSGKPRHDLLHYGSATS